MHANKSGQTIGVQLLIAIGVLLAFATSHMIAQGDEIVTLSVDDPRPLASMVQTLEKRYGWVITYEDPPYLYATEIEDVTLTMRRPYDPTKPRTLVPRGGQFTFRYTIPSGAASPDELQVLEKLLDEYSRSGHPGVFRVIQSPGAFHIVPSETKDAVGNFQATASLLDVNVSIPAGDRPALRMLEAITEAISRQAGAKVNVGTVPINLLMQAHVRAGATNESGRTVLLRTLESTNRKLSWRLLCGPGPVRECALNLHVVGTPTVQSK